MSDVKCENCGHIITHCPNCHHPVSVDKKDDNPFLQYSTVPAMRVDLNKFEGSNESLAGETEWNFNTSLPTPEIEEKEEKPELEDFFSPVPVSPTTHKNKSNTNPNPHLNRASLCNSTAVTDSSPYLRYRVKETMGNYNIEELTRIAVEKQFKEERRRKMRRKMIRRCLVFGVVLGVLLYNWEWIVYCIKMFINGWGAAIEIFSLLGGLPIGP